MEKTNQIIETRHAIGQIRQMVSKTLELIDSLNCESIDSNKPMDFYLVLNITCDHYHVNVSTILEKDRHMPQAEARQMLCYILHKRLGYSIQQIANWLVRERTTIHHNVKRAQKLLDTCPKCRKSENTILVNYQQRQAAIMSLG
jgi:chromosomal replication initiation ATPase DnaA